jgi:hypothetical protein
LSYAENHPVNGRIIGGMKDNIWRYIDFYSSVSIHTNIFKLIDIIDPRLI